MKYRITTEHNYGDKKVTLYRTETPTMEGEFGMQLVSHFGLIAGDWDGEDSAGRAKARLLTPTEAVARAFDLAAEAFRVMRERGMLVQLPDLNEVNADVDAERAAKDEKKREPATT